MWLKRRLERVCAHPGPILLEGGPAWGAPHLIAALAQPGRPLVWLELQKDNDPVLLGNKLADAVRRALTGPLFGYGLPYHYGLSLLKTQLKLLGPFTFALSNAAYAPELARDLLSLHDGENRVVLHFTPSCGGFALPENALLVTPGDLTLELEEAKELARELPEPARYELWATSGGAYEAFLIALHERLSLPPPLRPGPEGWQVIPGLTPTAAPDPLIAALLHRGRWLEALELAAQERPERVPEVLAAAGEVPWTQGLQGRLYGLLATLPAEVGRQEVVLTWRCIAALASGKEREVIPEVKAALASGNRPDLHALYAEACCHLGDLEAALVEAERAVRAQETPITLYTYGRALALRDPENGLEQLERALRLSESRNELYFAAQVAEALAARATTLGRYHRAADWAAWGLKLYHRQGMGQTLLRLALVNESAFARLLAGEAAGLEDSLRHESTSLGGVHPALARLLRTTLADLLLVQGDLAASLSLYREIWQDNERRENIGALANLYVRALLEAGEADEALRVGEQAVELTRGLHLVTTRRAVLAFAMALSEHEPHRAAQLLEGALQEFQQPLLAPRLAQASLYLARAQLRLGRPDRARAALEAGRAGLQELGREGLRYLAGPPKAFQGVFALLTGEAAALELRFLGAATARLGGEAVSLSQRLADLVAVLALHPEGMSGERLTLSIYGEFGSAKVCKAELARLRRLIPLKSRPYRLGLAVKADFLELGTLLRDGKLTQALARYRGPLLPKSDAPAVVAAREHLDETLRQAALASSDPEALWALAERWPEDLELWEALAASLSDGDPRRASVLARIKRLERTWGL